MQGLAAGHLCHDRPSPYEQQEPTGIRARRRRAGSGHGNCRLSLQEATQGPAAEGPAEAERQVLVLRDGPAASVTRSHALAPNLAGPALRLHQGEEEESMLRRFQSHAVTRPGHSALPGRHQDVWLPP